MIDDVGGYATVTMTHARNPLFFFHLDSILDTLFCSSWVFRAASPMCELSKGNHGGPLRPLREILRDAVLSKRLLGYVR